MTAACAVELAYEPKGLSWSSSEVGWATANNLDQELANAELVGLSGCSRHCERLERVFTTLVAEARTQSPLADTLPWKLDVVRLPGIEAMALPAGRILVSEPFIERIAPSDETLAFVLAHEMAHIILEHERQILSFAYMLLPRGVTRSVRDVYVELDYNFALLKQAEWVMQQGEFEADELGLLLASQAGFPPNGQLAYMEQEVAQCNDDRPPLIATHPPASLRLERLRERMPLAWRVFRAPASRDFSD